MCVQYRGGCSVPWGDIMSTVGDILSTVGVFSTVGGYHDKCGGISWVPWGVIMSTVGGYLEYRGGCSVPWGVSWCTWGISWAPWRVFNTVGGKSFVIWVPHGTEHPHGTHDIPPHVSWYPPTCIMISPHGTQISKDGIPPWYWTLPRYSWYPPMCIMISPHGTEHPPRYSR